VITVSVVAAPSSAACPRGPCPGRRMSPLQVGCSRAIMPERAWSMGTRAARSPHVDLEHP
jgi:hypothetical protein